MDQRPITIESSSKAIKTTSVSRLEKFYSCPYQYYFAYILALKKRQEGDYLGTENGTIIHSVLEQLFNDIRDGKVNESNVAKKAESYFDKAVVDGDFEYLLEKPQTKRLLMRVKKESVELAKDMFSLKSRSQFEPYLMEASIGKDPINPMSIKVGENEVVFNGIIDRIDVNDDKFMIIDYKTYSAELDIKDIYYGKRIQLYIYMKAVKDSINKKPAGVCYFPIIQGFRKDDQARFEYEGHFVKDPKILEQIDNLSVVEDVDSFKQSVLPINPSGSLPKSTYFEDEKQFDIIGDYALKIAAKGEEAIENGFIKPLPIKDACKWCDYKDTCAYCYDRERGNGKVTLNSFEDKEEDNND